MAVTVNVNVCVGCGHCQECPMGAIAIQNEKAQVDEDACVECGFCIEKCPIGAISL